MDSVIVQLSEHKPVLTVLSLLAVCWIISALFQRPTSTLKAPVHGYRSWWEPSILLQARFVTSAKDIISSGYAKFKDVPFTVRGYKHDITVLPMKYLDELRTTPSSILNGMTIQEGNILPEWTYTTVLIKSDLHFRVITQKLTREVPKSLFTAFSELKYGWNKDLPQSTTEWVEVDIQEIIRMLVSRMSAKIFMGYPACRDEDWLKLSSNYTIDVFTVAFILKLFPPWTHPIVARLIPARSRIRSHIKTAERVVGEAMKRHQEANERRERGQNDVEEQDVLMNWLMDNATEEENSLSEMAVRQSLLTVASIHTTSITASNVLYDLCAHPEWFDVLRDEITDVEKELGPLDDVTDKAAMQHWLAKLEKMDSFIMETQRTNPPILLNPQRMAIKPLTLKDGLLIPRGTRLAFPGYAHVSDPSVTPQPGTFDPMRSYRKRHSSSSPEASAKEMQRHLAGQISKDNLSFGFGTQACPGRYFAVGEIKTILAKLLMEFELRNEAERPRNMFIEENVIPDPGARLLIRKRG